MAKKDRSFFVCPSWKEVIGTSRSTAPYSDESIRVHGRILAAIETGQPIARSRLHKALLAVSHTTGTMFDADALIVDKRTRCIPSIRPPTLGEIEQGPWREC
jgi:hypothetical protein